MLKLNVLEDDIIVFKISCHYVVSQGIVFYFGTWNFVVVYGTLKKNEYLN